jgi:TRAP-type C4-dicarboxylate transport system permease small subunit
MKKLERMIHWTVQVGNILGQISGWMVAVMMFLIGYEVFMRYIFNNPPIIADEIAAYLVVAVSYLGIAYTFTQGGHVRITLLVSNVPPRVAKWLRVFTMMISEAFIIVMCVACYKYLSFSIMINERSASWLNFPFKYPQATLLIGFLAYALVLLGKIVKTIVMYEGNENAEHE